MIIAISGKKGSGKDLVGTIIQYLTSNSKNLKFIDEQNGYQSSTFKIKKFADKLKDIVCLLINCTREQLEDREFKEKELGEEWWYYIIKLNNSASLVPYTETKGELKEDTLVKLTPRKLLQLLGTECGRNIIHPNIWVNALMSEYKPISDISKSNTFTDNRLVHGYKNTKIWRTYYNIKQRCNNKKHPRFKDYGGKGIKMCKEWENDIMSFISWAINNGYNENLTIDRIDNLKNYSPDNCRCVSFSTQAINTNVRKDNTSGYRGVSYDKKNGNRIRANIQINKKIHFLGYFDTLEEASEAYELAFIERENLYEEQEKDNLIYPNIIITDMRFPNELKAVKDRGGISIRVNRIEKGKTYTIKDKSNGEVFEAIAGIDYRSYDDVVLRCKNNFVHRLSDYDIIHNDLHPSETALDNAEFDYVIDNNSTIGALTNTIEQILRQEKIMT